MLNLRRFRDMAKNVNFMYPIDIRQKSIARITNPFSHFLSFAGKTVFAIFFVRVSSQFRLEDIGKAIRLKS